MKFALNNNNRLSLISGPCALESYDNAAYIAGTLRDICARLNIDFFFKASIDKANRTAVTHYRGPGFEEGAATLQKVKDNEGVRIVTDIHEPWQAEIVASVADIIQIPAFLCRQTNLLAAAAKTQKIVNIKKAQFLSPEEMGKVAAKMADLGNNKILLCERGTAFGYNNLIVDMTSFVRMKKHGYPVFFDATHSVQISGGGENLSNSGAAEYAPYLAKAAIATGTVDGLFIETHPSPKDALCDGSCMIPLDEMEKLMKTVLKLYELRIDNCSEEAKCIY